MNRLVIWSPASENEFAEILDYLHRNWGGSVVNQFIDKMEESIRYIDFNPKIFPLVNKKLGIRKCIVTKHNTLYYRYSESKIELVRLFDNRQDPDKLIFNTD